MDFSTRLKGLLDPGILGGMFDGSPDETLSRFLPPDQINRIPEDQRAWYAQQAIRSTQADGRAGAQQRLLEFAKLREGQILAEQTARSQQELRGEIDQATRPMYRGMSMAAEQGAPLGPTKLAQSLAQTTEAQLPSIQQAIRIKALGGPDLIEGVIKAKTPIAMPTGNSIHPVTGAVVSTPKLPDGMVQDTATGAVNLANGFLPAQGAIARQAAGIDTQAKFDTEEYVAEQTPYGIVYRGKLSGLTREQKEAERQRANPQPGMPQPGPAQQVPGLVTGSAPQVGRPGSMPQPQGDLSAQISAAVAEGDPERVLQLEQQRSGGRLQGTPASYTQAMEVQKGRIASDQRTSSEALVKAVQPSFDGAMAASGALSKAYDLKKLVTDGVYARMGILPGDYVEMAARLLGADPQKLANGAALKRATTDELLVMAQKLRPASDTDIKLIQKATANPDSMTVGEMKRLADLVINDHKKTIKGHGEMLKRFPADRVSTAFGGMNLSVDEPPDHTLQMPPPSNPLPPVRGPMPPPPGVTAPNQSGRPGFTFREIK
jgi:hypothetical protein